MFCALLGGTGLRAGEALGLEVGKHISDDFGTLYIRQKVRRGKLEDFLKTEGGRRDVDICPALAEILKKYVGDRTSGFLFQNKNGNSFSQTNLLRRGLHPALKNWGNRRRASTPSGVSVPRGSAKTEHRRISFVSGSAKQMRQ